MRRNKLALLSLMVLMLGVSLACGKQPVVSPTPTVAYSQYQLRYQLLAKYPDYFWCDLDLYPVGRPEEPNAQQQFPDIQANTEEFSAILQHLGIAEKANYTDAEKLSIYREHKKLIGSVMLTLAGGIYEFSIRTGENEGLHIEGTITPFGEIKVIKQEPSINTCPICLAKGTLIDTPNGPIQIEKLKLGMAVWSVDSAGNRLAVTVLEVKSMPVPTSFEVVKIVLENGRSVTASPGHPTAEKKVLGSYRIGDSLDGSLVTHVETSAYSSGETYDLLPFGETGIYWANGILLRSTLVE